MNFEIKNRIDIYNIVKKNIKEINTIIIDKDFKDFYLLKSLNYIYIKLFICNDNEYFDSLKYLPRQIENLEFHNNQINSLKYLPKSVENLNCSDNNISSLKYLPKSISYLDCSNNPIKNLKYLNKKLKILICKFTNISSVKYINKSLKYLNCSMNSIKLINIPKNSNLNILKCQVNNIEFINNLPKNLNKIKLGIDKYNINIIKMIRRLNQQVFIY